MRLPASKVYRAFPELDRFSDDQCQTFVKAASRGVARRMGRLVIQTAAMLLTFGVCSAVITLCLRAANVTPARAEIGVLWEWLGFAVMALDFGVSGLAWLVTKDRLLRRRIRQIMNARGSCGRCGYALAGLPVGADLRVTCPECGSFFGADESLGEAAPDETGARRFLPSPDAAPSAVRRLSPEQRRRLIRLAIGVPTGVVLVIGLALGGYEWFLHHQAAVARAARAQIGGWAGVLRVIEKYQPAGAGPGAPDAWETFHDAARVLAETDDRVWRSAALGDGNATYPDFSQIYAPVVADDPDANARNVASRALALRLIREYRDDGVFSRLTEMAKRRRAVRPQSAGDPEQPLVYSMLPELGQVRDLSRIGAARMHLAVGAGDVKEFEEALETNLALTRMLDHEPFLIERLISDAVGAMTCQRALVALAGAERCDWIVAARGAYERQGEEVSELISIEGEQTSALDTVEWLFSDPSRVRLGRFSKEVRALFGGPNGAPMRVGLGTYWQNRDAIERYFKDLGGLLSQEPWQRTAATPVIPDDLVLAQMLLPATPRLLSASDQSRVRSRGMKVLLAVEQFRCDRGAYPVSLAELVPSYLAVMPQDPWSGKPFGYRRIDGADGKAPTYTLYSVGPDGTDDGGAFPAVSEFAGQIQPTTGGLDVLIGPVKEEAGGGH